MTSRLASRPPPRPRPLRRGRGSFRVTSRRRAVCARRSHRSPPCAALLSEVTLRGGARVGATPPLASPAPAILAGPVGPNSTGSLPPSPVGVSMQNACGQRAPMTSQLVGSRELGT
jgi:hypothetical protein